MRRAFFLFAGLAVVGAFLACASDDEVGIAPEAGKPGDGGGALDAQLVGDSSASVVDADPGPGDVCGDTSGLQANGAWPLAGACPTRAGWSAEHSPQSTTVREIATFAGGSGSAAIGSDGTLWIGATDGAVLHMSANGGQIFQQITLPKPVKSTPAIDNLGQAVVTCEDGNLYVLNNAPVDAGVDVDASAPPLLNIQRQIQIGPSDGSPVIAADGTIYVGTNDGNLVAVAAGATTSKWSKPTGDTLGNSPAIDQNGVIYVGSTDHSLRAFGADGTQAWALDLGAEIHQSPAVGGDGTIYIGTADGKLHAVTSAGKEKWSYSGATAAFVGAPAVYAGQVYAASEDKKIHAVATVDGSARWSYLTQGTPTTPVIDSDSHLDFGSSDGHIYVLSERGTLYFAGSAKSLIGGGTALGPQGIYVVTATGLDVMGP